MVLWKVVGFVRDAVIVLALFLCFTFISYSVNSAPIKAPQDVHSSQNHLGNFK
jgi:hypothetical protein